jgi:hypothetical protein
MALSEMVGVPLPYDDVLGLRDRMWKISPTLVGPDVTEHTSVDVVLAGLQALVTRAATVNAYWGRIYEAYRQLLYDGPSFPSGSLYFVIVIWGSLIGLCVGL